MDQALIEPTVLEQLFQDAPFIGDARSFISTVELLHHRYLQLKLLPQAIAPELNLELLEDGAYYLSALATTPDRVAEIENQQLVIDALSVAALIFEYLGDLARTGGDYRHVLENNELYYLDACICNSLSIYESNAMALARRRLLADGMIEDILESFEPTQILTLCRGVIYTWLGRDFQRLWTNAGQIRNLFESVARELRDELRDGAVSTATYREVKLWTILAQATLTHAHYFQFGEEDHIDEAAEAFERAKELAEQQHNPAYYWTISALHQCATKMHSDSVWTCLGQKFPRRYVRALVAGSRPIYELWTSQVKALRAGERKGLEDGYLDDRIRRVLINMPTSAGKSLLAEMAIVRALFPQPDMHQPDPEATCVYVVPSIALVNEVERRLNGRLLPLGVRVTAVLGGFDVALFEKQLFAQTKVAVLTPEKLSLLVRQDEPFIQSCRLFVFDEIHKVDSLSRGWTLEEIVTWLKDFHPQARNAKMVFMSAVMSNRRQLELWLAQADTETELVPILSIDESWRPTRQLKAICYFDERDEIETEISKTPQGRLVRLRWIWGHLSYIRDRTDLRAPKQLRRIIRTKQAKRQRISRRGVVSWKKDYSNSFNEVDNAVQLASKFVEAELDPVLVFFMKRDQTSAFCEKLTASQDIQAPALSPIERKRLQEACSYIGDRLGDEFPLVKYLTKGIAFHHGQLPRDIRAEIEYAFSRGWIRVLASTTTLAEGVNFPITTFILANHQIRIGKDHLWLLEKKDFCNMIGRAGRAVFDTEGQIIFMLPLTLYSQEWLDYLFPRDEDTEQWILSPFVRQDFRREVLENLLDVLEAPGPIFEALDVDPDYWKAQFGPGAEQAAHIVLRLQAFLLSMMDRKIIDPESLETFFAFFRRTLFAQQLDIAPGIQDLLASLCFRTAQAIVANEPDPHRRSAYSKTGLAFKSSKDLFDFAQIFWKDRGQLLCDQPVNHLTPDFLLELGTLIFCLREARPSPVRRSRAPNSPLLDIPHGEVLVDWIVNQYSIRQIQEKYFAEITDLLWSSEACANYIHDAFEYKAPWALSAFALFVKHAAEQDGIMDFEATELGFQLSMLPAYAKLGVNTPSAAFFASLGIRTKEMANLLARAYSQQYAQQERNFATMLEWLLALEPEEVANWYQESLGEDTSGQVARLFRVIRSLQATEIDLRQRFPVDLYVAGWYYYQGQQVLHTLSPGQVLVLEPEPTNPHDESAVKVLTGNGLLLGYIPMSHSAAVARLLRSGEMLTCRIVEINPPPSPTKQRLRVRLNLS